MDENDPQVEIDPGPPPGPYPEEGPEKFNPDPQLSILDDRSQKILDSQALDQAIMLLRKQLAEFKIRYHLAKLGHGAVFDAGAHPEKLKAQIEHQLSALEVLTEIARQMQDEQADFPMPSRLEVASPADIAKA